MRSNKMAISTYLSIITVNINELNDQNALSDWIKNQDLYKLARRKSLQG